MPSGCENRGVSLPAVLPAFYSNYQITGPFDDEYGAENVRAVDISRATGECKVLGAHDFGRDLDSKDLPERRYGVPEKCTDGKRYIVRAATRGLSVKRCTPRA